MAYNEDSSASGHDEPWIQWFCGLKGHEMFCEVERSYIEDGFNLYGLRACVSNFSDCLDLILDRIGPDDSDDSHLTQSACTLYGLIHARYIITAHGLDAMYNKYAAKEFGTCPLVQCAGQPVLPVGLKDEMGADTVKIFCTKCRCVYHPPPVRSRSSHHATAGSAGVDGAAFGTTFPHLFLMTFNNLVPERLPMESAYVPRVFGFRVHSHRSLAATAERAREASENAAANNNNNNNNNRRPPARRPAAAGDAAERRQNSSETTGQEGAAAAAPRDRTQNEAVEKVSKGSSVSSKQAAKNANEDTSPKEEGVGSSTMKKRGSKRRGDSANDATAKKSETASNGIVDGSSKKRRKGDNNG